MGKVCERWLGRPIEFWFAVCLLARNGDWARTLDDGVT